jgi:hypothetical protein
MSDIEIPSDISPKAVAVARQVLDVLVQYPAFTRVHDTVVADSNILLQLKMPSGMIVLAESGMGKTLLLDVIAKKLAASTNSLEKASPVLRMSLDCAVDVHSLASKTMMALDYPALPTRPKLEVMTHMVDRAMERLRPKAWLIDECQHMCEGNRDITARAVTDWIKVRMDKHNVPVVCTGTPVFERICDINDQFVSRVSAKYSLNPFVFGDPWVQLMQAIARHISHVKADVLESPWCLKVLHTVTKGNLRSLKRLLVYSVIVSADRPEPVLTRNDLFQGFNRAFGHKEGSDNPFFERSRS